jgi:hypothetical protein
VERGYTPDMNSPSLRGACPPSASPQARRVGRLYPPACKLMGWKRIRRHICKIRRGRPQDACLPAMYRQVPGQHKTIYRTRQQDCGQAPGAGRSPPAHRGLRPGGSSQYGILGSLVAWWLAVVLQGLRRAHTVLRRFYDRGEIRICERTAAWEEVCGYFVAFGLKPHIRWGPCSRRCFTDTARPPGSFSSVRLPSNVFQSRCLHKATS